MPREFSLVRKRSMVLVIAARENLSSWIKIRSAISSRVRGAGDISMSLVMRRDSRAVRPGRGLLW